MPSVWPKDRPRAVIHINVADFAVAVERLEDPGLRGWPVIVAPQGAARARVFDMSEEAFQAGVRKHMPLARAQRLCREAKIAAPRPHCYEKAMAALLKRAAPFSPLVEAEEDSGHLFLDLTGTARLFGPPQDVAQRLRRTVRGELGLDPIWGLAGNKLVAKVATRVVKPSGEHIVEQGGEEAFLRPLPLFLLPGLEREDLLALGEFHLHRVQQALAWSPEHLAVVFGKRAVQVHGILRGRDDSPVLPLGHKPPVLRLEQELGQDSNRVPEVEAILWRLVERAGAALRGQGRVARRLVLSLDYSDGARIFRQRSHQPGTANDFVLFDLARACLASAWARRVRLRHLCLSFSRLTFPPAQMELPFGEQDPPLAKGEALLAALDAIRRRHGLGKIKLGRGLEAQ
ncbi:MAG: hypothetical protein KQI62_00975 [Deltaproteobacteria bacterium]|nr:hypothetical protein [Deltaproteobacteria bacterium]